MSTRAVFFDMDDTLLDGHTAMEASWLSVCTEASARVGAPAEHLREVFRAHAREFWKDESKVEHWRIRLTEARAHVIELGLRAEGLDHTCASELSHLYSALHREHLCLFEDAIETLHRVRDAGYHVGLLTNGPAEMQRDKINRFDLEQYFDVIVVEGEFGRGKPHPEVFQHALAAVGVNPYEAWHVGDNLYADVGGAKSAGLRAAWIHRDRLQIPDDVLHRPDAEIGHLIELDDIVAG